MKSRKVSKTVTKTEEQKPQVVVQELRVVSPDRRKKDIGDFRNSLISAESEHYPNRTRLYDLYNDIMLDGHLTGIIGKRFDAVLNKNIYYADATGKRVKEMDDFIDGEAFRDIITRILEVPVWGLSGLEFIPGPEVTFKDIPRKHIKPHKKIIVYEQNDETSGINYEGVSNLWVIGKEKDLGLLLKCSVYALYKRGNMADWAQYVEIFGQPVRVLYYDSYDEKTKMELRQVLDESGSSLALMIPKQAQFEMKDGKQSNGTGELQEKFKIALDNEMSIIILGNTETTSSSKSSGYAQSKEHGKQQLEITKSDLKYVRNKLNSIHFLNVLKSYGLPVVEGGKFKYEKEIDLSELKTRMEIDEKIKAMGVPMSDDYIYDTYGVPKPDNYNELKAQKEAQTQPAQKPEEDTDQEEAPAKNGKKTAQKPLKKKLKANFWFKLREELADFFDPARLK